MTDQGDWADLMSQDLEHVSAEELRGIVVARLPQPGERHNTSSIPVSDLALAALLSLAQQGMVLAECQVEDCENCNEHRLIWWDCCNALDRSTRIAMQAWLIAKGWGLPEAPWEDAVEVENYREDGGDEETE